MFTLALIGLAARVGAQTYAIDWHTVDGGGHMVSTGGGFELGGTIGQHDAGTVLTGGTYQLTGGFWSVATPVCTCPGDMNGDGQRNGKDLQQFVTCAVSGGSCSCADMNGDSAVTATDITLLVNGLLAGSACP